MARPVILTVDDDVSVSQAVARDLRGRYAERFRIIRATSGAEALTALDELRRRDFPVALILSDHRMPEMTGIEFLERARPIAPDAKLILLTAYADTEVAIKAINEIGLDHYLMKPWAPPEERLYPVLDDLLDAWDSAHGQRFDGVRVIGNRWSERSYETRMFLARNHVPYQWLELECDPEAERLLALFGTLGGDLPLVLLTDGTALHGANTLELAGALGLHTTTESTLYDVVVVGAGPAGLAAAVYASSEGLRTIVIERDAPGGQAGQSARIENYLGFPNGVSGNDLAGRATVQARRLGAEILTVQGAVKLKPEGSGRFVELSGGGTLSGNCVLIASGVSYRQMDAPGFEELSGAGIYYGAAPFEADSCANQHVVVIGAGNSAGQAAVHFSGKASQVSMLVRGPSLSASMSSYLIDQIEGIDNIDVRTGTSAIAAHGDDHLEKLTLKTPDGEVEEHVDACFIFIGAAPRTDWLDGVVARDERGFILSGLDAKTENWPLGRDPYTLETNVPGVFVAGDVRARSVKRVAGAVGEGSMSVSLIHQYLADG